MALRFETSGTVLIERVDYCTCGLGPNGYYGSHEYFCGAEPYGDLEGDDPVTLGSMAWEVN